MSAKETDPKNENTKTSLEFPDYDNELMGDDMVKERDAYTAIINEKLLVRKVDIRLVTILSCWEICSRIDGTSILSNAKLGGLLEDLNMTEAQYRWCLTAPFIAFLVVSVPINLMLRAWRPSFLLGALAMIWGGLTMAAAGATNFSGLIVCQTIQGATSSANNAVQIYYVSLWYKRKESAQRLGWIYIAGTVVGSFRGLISFAMMQIPTTLMNSWQWYLLIPLMFILYGIPSVLCGVLCLIALPDEPEYARFLSESERKLIIHRISAERAFTSSKEPWSWAQVTGILNDWKLYAYLMMYVLVTVAQSGARLNLPPIVDGMGYWSRPVSLALTTPPQLAACIVTFVCAYLSDKYGQRAYVLTGVYLSNVLGLFLIMFVPDEFVGLRYFAICVLCASLAVDNPVRNAWCSDNFSGLTRRAGITGILFMADAAGNTIGGQAYFDPPRYLIGHAIALGCTGASIVLVLILRAMLSHINKRRDKMEPEKKIQEIAKFGGEQLIGDRHPDYRYSL